MINVGDAHAEGTMLHFSEHLDHLRKAADFGYIILGSTEHPEMSGSNTMCVATVLLETGTLSMAEPVSPAGS